VIKSRVAPLIVSDQSLFIIIFIIDLGSGHMLVFVTIAAYSENADECREEQSPEHVEPEVERMKEV